MEKRRRLVIETKTFEGFISEYPELPNIPGIIEQNGYLLALPAALEIMGIDGLYKVEVVEKIDGDGCVFHIVTNQEDYEYSLYQFLESDRFVVPNNINVLVLYFDEELGIYTTLCLKVKLGKLDNRVVKDDTYGQKGQFLVQFRDFKF